MKNFEIARLFDLMADVLELRGENPFRIRAYRRAARNLESLTEDVEVGKVYHAKVKRLMNFGAFCEILPGKEGLVHVSELSDSLKVAIRTYNVIYELLDNIEGVLKEALIKGISNGSDLASQIDGYFKNPAIKIPFPPDVKKVEDRLRQIGLGGEVDKFVMTLNRGAEDAAKEA